jgi:hypothetical protein
MFRAPIAGLWSMMCATRSSIGMPTAPVEKFRMIGQAAWIAFLISP